MTRMDRLSLAAIRSWVSWWNAEWYRRQVERDRRLAAEGYPQVGGRL